MQLGIRPAAGRRMRKAKTVRAFEHQDRRHVPKLAVVECFVETHRRVVAKQALRKLFVKPQLEFVVHVANGALVVMPLRAELLPGAAIAEVDRLVRRRIDVRRPEQTDVAVGEGCCQ